jgi:hypothetical protein
VHTVFVFLSLAYFAYQDTLQQAHFCSSISDPFPSLPSPPLLTLHSLSLIAGLCFREPLLRRRCWLGGGPSRYRTKGLGISFSGTQLPTHSLEWAVLHSHLRSMCGKLIPNQCVLCAGLTPFQIQGSPPPP